MEVHILGGVCSHIKAFGTTPIPTYQRKIHNEEILGQYPFSILGRTLFIGDETIKISRYCIARKFGGELNLAV